MGNIVELREKLTFGKFKGCTGGELLKSPLGTGYLAWLYNNTDIRMDQFVVEALIAAKLVDTNVERRNSKAGGAIIKTDGVTCSPTPEVHIVKGSNFEQMLRHGGGLPPIQTMTDECAEVPLKFTPLKQGREECAKLREMILRDKLGTVDELFRAALRKQMRHLKRDTDF